MIHSDHVSDVYSKGRSAIWLISAFKAGLINSIGFLATGKFVSHVTGFGTQVGIAVGHDEFFFGAELLVIPFAFIFGGVVTSWILDRNYEKNETPPYWKVQGLITFLILGLIILGEVDHIQSAIPFDKDDNYNLIELAIITILCLVCGLKNSLVTWGSYGRIRVTHLTGLSTDIGLNLIRTFNPSQPSPRFKEERRVNLLRIMTFVAFSTGAMISAMLFPQIGFRAFTLVFFISLGMTGVSIWDARKRYAEVSEVSIKA